ncbi:hypothetical protein BJ322DRAFT_1017253 [Thelephora terrestris]|uniref:Uncharacterized protein n=1 Tax=Thelephora terrestris TaxID=56493 RepID=A0A9P6HMX4_9AGAM|nr:hypothetical protein BJ322DRAFT_1017253 [Thelephora terrestris]
MTLYIKDLKLGYKFSTHPQREVPQILSTPAAFIRMKDDAVTQICERGNSLGKGKKGKSRDVFRVILVDSGRKTHEKTVVMKGKKNALAKGPLEEEDEPSEKGAGEHLSVLLSRYTCPTHSRLCYAVSDTDHKALSHGDLGIWSTMITAGHATLDNPPGSLQIEQRPSVRALTKQPTTGSGLAPSTSTSELLLMEFIKNNSSSRLYSRSQSRSQSQSSSPRKRPKLSSVPIFFNNPAVYPKLDAWLESLDHGPRNIDNHNFGQFLGKLTDSGVTRVHHLVPEAQIFTDRNELMEACPGMNWATATLLLQFARDDVANVASTG